VCVFRGIAFREQGFYEAAREAFKEALRSKKRDPVVRHRALLERAKGYLSEGRQGLARKDLEQILAEDSGYEGLRELLDELQDGAATPAATSSPPHADEADRMDGPLRRDVPSSSRAERVWQRHQPSDRPGLVPGRHYTEWVEPVKQLKREGRLEEAEVLLLECVDAVEAQARAEDRPVAPWYYEQLGIVYRKLGDKAASDAIAQRHATAPSTSRPYPAPSNFTVHHHPTFILSPTNKLTALPLTDPPFPTTRPVTHRSLLQQRVHSSPDLIRQHSGICDAGNGRWSR
jgi:tetratricopeptide (TPR) repeat protein